MSEPPDPAAALPEGEAVDAAPASLPAPRRLEGRFVALEPLDPVRHLDDLYTCSHGAAEREALWTYMAYGPFADRSAMGAWLAGCAASRDPLFFAVLSKAGGRAVGMASFLNIDPAMGRLELGHIWYAPESQRTAVNTETVYLLLSEAFDRLGYRRAEWKCDALNARSRAAALRLGFSFEGLFRQHMIVKGRNRDTAWYAILDGDWPRAKAAMAARLAAPPPTG